MKFCPQCGSELKEEAKFCPSCGFKIVSQQQAPPPEPAQPTFQPKEATNAFTDAITGKTNLVNRVSNILIKPKVEWPVINNEQPNTMKLIFGYAFILALLPALVSFIKYGIIGISYMGYTSRSIATGIQTGLVQLLSAVIGVYVLALIIDMLAPSFDSQKNFGRSLQLAVYSSTPQWIAGILVIFSVKASVLIGLLSLYAIYLLVTGMPVIKQTPKEKVAGYVIVTIIVMILLSLLLALILGAILGLFFVGSVRGFGI
jgi:hypothetical protein